MIVLILMLLVMFWLFNALKDHRQIVMFTVTLLLFSAGISSNVMGDLTQTQNVVAAKVTKITAKDKYETVKKENDALIAKERELKKQERKFRKQRDVLKEQEKKANRQSLKQNENINVTDSSSRQDSTDMNTSETGKVVGNKRTRVYHMPDQSGYNMSSKNAVYFSTEQEAINAGYRQAKR